MIVERKLIHTDEKGAESQIKDLIQYKPLLQNLRSTYEAMGIGEFNDAVFKQCLEDPEIYRGIYRQKVETHLDKMGVTIQSVKENFIQVSNKEISEFLTAAFELKDFQPKRYQTENYPILPLSSISFLINEFSIRKNEQDKLKEQFRVYVETPEEANLYEAMQKLKPAYKAFYEALKQSGVLPRVKIVNSHFVNLEVLFRAKEDGSLEVNPGIFSFIKHTLKFKNN